jgi:subtilisin family serine protease
MKTKFIIALILIITNIAVAQKKTPKNWQLLNPSTDKVYGMGIQEAYKLLKDKKAKTIIVAVIDSGVETDHEDLKSVIWTNIGEIPDNGIDDDKNGYIDDVHGWSFLGGKTDDINYEAYEVARMYRTMRQKYKSIDTTKLSVAEAKEFADYKKLKADYKKELRENQINLQRIVMLDDFVKSVKMKNHGTFSKQTVKEYKPENELEKRIKKRFKLFFALGMNEKELENELSETRTTYENMLKMNTVNADSIRQAVVGDDPNDTINRYYGCNRVKGPDASHGTHVSGIIAAVRGNNIGMDGIANNVLIMPIRAVPNGDERDKDIANAIRYAVDNGATVINMSFGKYYSPDKSLIDEAVRYAASKDVLIIHAAGNESKDSDKENGLSFPNREFPNGTVASNWIQVGACAYKPGKRLLADFSNYGAKHVDLFAPGVDVYSTIPDSKYQTMSGTSMASPSVAGAVALIRGYFPELTAQQVREVLMKTAVHYKKKVIVPGTKRTKKKVEELCISGGFINVNAAVIELLNRK